MADRVVDPHWWYLTLPVKLPATGIIGHNFVHVNFTHSSPFVLTHLPCRDLLLFTSFVFIAVDLRSIRVTIAKQNCRLIRRTAEALDFSSCSFFRV